jgi:hypothetical protein
MLGALECRPSFWGVDSWVGVPLQWSLLAVLVSAWDIRSGWGLAPVVDFKRFDGVPLGEGPDRF